MVSGDDTGLKASSCKFSLSVCLSLTRSCSLFLSCLLQSRLGVSHAFLGVRPQRSVRPGAHSYSMPYILESVVLDPSKVLSGSHTYSERAVLARDPPSLAHGRRPLFSFLGCRAGCADGDKQDRM